MTNICSSRHTLLYTMKNKIFHRTFKHTNVTNMLDSFSLLLLLLLLFLVTWAAIVIRLWHISFMVYFLKTRRSWNYTNTNCRVCIFNVHLILINSIQLNLYSSWTAWKSSSHSAQTLKIYYIIICNILKINKKSTVCDTKSTSTEN